MPGEINSSTGPFSSFAVANVFLELAREEGQALSNMKLQKLVFLAQGYCLAILGRPLYFHDTKAWQWGPVVPQLYKRLQKFGSGEVTSNLEATDSIPVESEEIEIIRGVWAAYKDYSASDLSNLTHRAETPWQKTWEANQFGVIPQDLMQNFYSALVNIPR